MKSFKIMFALTLISQLVYAQQSERSFLGVDMGVIGYLNQIREKDYIRQLSSNNSNDRPTDKFSGSLITSFVGLKYERLFLENRLGVMAGIRFTKTNSGYRWKGFFRSGGDYFYVRVSEEGTTTEYLRLKKIWQESSHIGMPLEIRYLFFKNSFTRLYFKIGSSFDFLLKTKNGVNIYDNYYRFPKAEREAAEKSGVPADFSSSLYGAIGLRLGKNSSPVFNIELSLPSLLLYSNYSTLVKPTAGMGIQFMVQFPLKSKK